MRNFTGVGQFGTWLANEMNKREITRKELSEGIGLTINTIHRHLHCCNYPTWNVLVMYSRYFDVSYDELVDLVLADKKNKVRDRK